ncbi:MAG: hypothetical protein NTV99_00250 [Deltaproteobacteria bacterium]|nr:hypothetical protein [Deltaproteobacteria bacterium]
MKNLKSLMLGMLVGLVMGPLLISALALLYITAKDYRSLTGENWAQIVSSIISLAFTSTPFFMGMGGIIGLVSNRLNFLLAVLLGGVLGALCGYLSGGIAQRGDVTFGPSLYIIFTLICGVIIALIVKRIASSKIPVDWDVDLSGDRRSKYLPDRPQE